SRPEISLHNLDLFYEKQCIQEEAYTV
ncbi:hypothetical protein C7448_1183, partial [Tenacibaculum gallaicum]